MFMEKTHGLEKQHGHIHENLPEIEHEHEHEHPERGLHSHWHRHTMRVVLSLWGLATFAFILGFAHEEEFALLALVASGVNAFSLMAVYGLSVTISLIAVTILCIRIYTRLQPRLIRYEKYVPKVGATILLVMAAFIIFL
jgi:high-affinity nickel permease